MLSWLLGSGQSIPFDVGDEVEDYSGKTIWKLYAGSDKKDGSAVSIFACHLSADRSEVERAAARNALKRCKTIKHPYVLRFIDGMELEDGKGGHTVYIITEAVTPLETALKDGKLPEAATAWGLRSVVAVAAFLHQGGLMHGNINLSSIFTNRAGDWMLGGFELLCDPRAAGLAAFNAIKDLLPRKLQSPELTRGQFTVLEQASVGVTDSWLLGITIYEVFSGRLDRPDQLKDTARIPRQLAQDYTRLLSGNVPGRLPVAELLKNSFFDTEYCHTQEFLETLNVKDPAEKERFFVKLTSQVGMLPPAAAKYKVLPALVQNLEYGGGSARTLTLMLRVAVELTEDEFQTEVVPIITKLFGNNDRAMRVPLLENLPSIVNNIPARVLNDNIFANMASGFTDTSAQLREMTVKAVVPLAPHLVQRALAHVLRAFATLQRDEEPAIRTNTTICLGKITQYIDAASRQRVLIAAFCRALADPFAPARRAGALSLAATQAFHAPADCARKIVPAVSPLMLDPDTEVRKAALQCLQVYVAKLEGESRRMAARESGVEEEEPTDAVAVANKVATESVMESMTWVSSMLGKVGLGSVVSGADNAQPKAVDATAGSSSSGVLQPTPAPPVHQPSAPTASAALQAGTGAEAAGAASTDGWARPGINGSGLLRDADFDEALAGAPPLPTQAPPPPPTQAPPLPTQAPPPPPIQASPPQPAPLAPPVEVASVGAAVPASGSSGSLTGRKPGRLGAKKEPSDWGADDFFSDLNTPSGWSTSGLATPARGAPPPLPVQPTPPAAPMATLAASARHSAPQPQQQVRRPMPPPQHLQQRQQGSTQGSSCMQGSGLPAASLGPMTAAPRLDGPAQQVPRKQDVDPVGLLSVPRATSAQGPHGRLGAKKVDTSNDWDAW